MSLILGAVNDTAALLQLIVSTLVGAGVIWMGWRGALRRQIRSVITEEMSELVRTIVRDEVSDMARSIAYIQGKIGNGRKE